MSNKKKLSMILKGKLILLKNIMSIILNMMTQKFQILNMIKLKKK